MIRKTAFTFAACLLAVAVGSLASVPGAPAQLLIRSANTGAAPPAASPGGGGGQAPSSPLIHLDNTQTTNGGTTYGLYYGSGLGSSVNMTVASNAGGPGADNGTNVWNWSHVGDYMQYDRWAGTNGDPLAGWYWNGSTVSPNGYSSWTNVAETTPICFMFDLYVEAPLTQGTNTSAQMKWFIFGGPGLADGADRSIIFFERATDGTYGTGDNDTEEITVRIGSGVGAHFTGVTVPVGQWNYLQFCVRYTQAGTPYQRAYLNNNVEGSPTSQNTDFSTNSGGTFDAPESWGEGHWGDIASTNAYTGADARFRTRHFYIDDAFNPNWAP